MTIHIASPYIASEEVSSSRYGSCLLSCAFSAKDDTAQVLYINGLYLEAVVANFFLRKPLVQKIVGDWAWERATNKGWVTDKFEEFQNSEARPQGGMAEKTAPGLRTAGPMR